MVNIPPDNGTTVDGTSARPTCCAKEKKSVVFLFPGLDGGDVWQFLPLLSMVEAPLLFVPIRYRHWSELGRDANELDRLITDCVRQIESCSPPAPIYLAGYSFGGQMAWAVARAMTASGHQIGLLGLIDAPAVPEIPEGAATVAGRLGRLVRGIRRRATSHQLARSAAGVLFRSKTSRMRDTFRRLYSLRLLPQFMNRVDLNLQMQYSLIILKECIARLASSDEQIDCPAVLFRCAERPPGEATDLGWSRHLANLRVVTLSGNHDNVLQAENAVKITHCLTMMTSDEATNPACIGRSLARE
jgi:thioesterase domain-containing protein